MTATGAADCDRFDDDSRASLGFEILENIAEGFCAIDRDWRIIYINKRACDMSGIPQAGSRGQNLWHRLPHFCGTENERLLRDAVEKCAPAGYETHFPLTGRFTHVRVCTISPDVIGIYWLDITDAKLAEQRAAERTEALAKVNILLDQSEERRRDIFKKVPLPMSILDVERRFTEVNDAWIELFGYDEHEMIGRPLDAFLANVSREGVEARWNKFLRHGELRNAERHYQKKTGEIIEALIDVRLERDQAGNFAGAVTAITDVTARKRAEMAASRERERSRLLIESSTEGIIGLDREYRYTVWNLVMETLSGTPRDRLLGRYVFDVRPDLLGTEIEEAWRAAMEGRRTTFSERPFHFKESDRSGFYLADFAPLYDADGSIVGAFAFLRDITERRRIEEQFRQAQKMEAMGQLTGGIAHDFNNLLTVIMGNVDALRHRLPANAELERGIDAAMRAANRAATLTQRLLAYARRQPLAPKPIDVNKLVSGMSDLLRRSLGEIIAVETVLADAMWRTNADPNQLESAILNLAVNARDAMQNGGKLTIETANAYLEEDYAAAHDDVSVGQYVMIAVSDTGTGMTKEVVARAFEPFFTTKGVGQGTGLGLAQVYGFVKQSGGHVNIYSELGQGTTVKLYLPRLVETESYGEGVSEAPSIPLSACNETILVVEDDEDVRSFNVNVLAELGYRVIEAPDGPSALAILDVEPQTHLLFTDVGLPGGLDGRQLAEEARRRLPTLKILFTTGYAHNAVIHQGRLDPGVEFIGKPFTQARLATKIRQILQSGRR